VASSLKLYRNGVVGFIDESYGRGAGVGRDRGVGRGLGVSVAVGLGVAVAVGVEVAVAVAVGVGDADVKTAQYLAPVFKSLPGLLSPPQMIISVPVHTAVCDPRPMGAVVMLVGRQVSVVGLYLPPVLKEMQQSIPPQIIISSPVQTAV
jgi:hypothetical protein